MQPRELSAHSVYRAGRGIEEVARELGMDPDELIKLSSNENPLGPSPAATDAIHECADHVHTYPKTAHSDLIEAIAREWDVEPRQVWLANGGDGALDYLARAFLEPGDQVLVSDPGFAYYAMSARYHHGTVATYPLRKSDDFEQTAENILESYDGDRIVCVTSPHNPSGRELPREELLTLADRTDDSTLVLVDEAYGEFSDSPSAIELLSERDDIAVLRTFSKAYGLAGLRLGYLVAPTSWTDAYARVNTPFAASEIACRAGKAALGDDAHLEETSKLVAWSRAYMHEQIDARTWPSAGNFILVEVGDADAVATASQEHGVIIRDCTSFGLPECVRITCGTREQTKRAVEVINECI
ncbi:histidinol-phosphate transaminase [Halocatena marina]|uniref:histidinol-phosphate transaminase n=1 Tax=Halocatena marina TaxID=2934937 RepID=UPI00200DEA7C|nr:histidinol-phosphate transaminase [Halocatena marina]